MRFYETLKSRFDPGAPRRLLRGALQAAASVGVLGTSLYLALLSRAAVREGRGRAGGWLAAASLLLAAVAAATIVPRLARRIDFGFLRLPFSFRVTREGAVYILGALALSLAAINTGNNLLFLILAFQLSSIVASGIFARASLRAITVSLDVPENVFVGDPVSVRVTLRNRKRYIPAVSLRVEETGAIERASRAGGSPRAILRQPAYFPILSPGEAKSELVVQSFPARGSYRLQGFEVSTRFPFGLFQRGERVRAEGEILVYPEIQEVSSYFHLLPFQAGRFEGRQLGLGESLYAIRKYREGESARFVDWKATAKIGTLMSREFSRDEEFRFCLILDTMIEAGPSAPGRDLFEKAVSLAASLAVHFSEEGAEVEFLTAGRHLPRRAGADQLYSILRVLAVVEPQPASAGGTADLREEWIEVLSAEELQEILSEKVFKIILTSKPRGSFSTSVWHSSHVVYFDEL